MAKVDKFNLGKFSRDDEFYTRYEDIQNELNHYEKQFEGKTVFCNCDDPYESNFCKYFLKNFNYLKLRRLICTSYTSSPVLGVQMSLFDDLDMPVKPGHGYVIDITNVPMSNGRGVSDEDIDKLLHSKNRGVKRLAGNGDFRSEECVEYLKQADIVCTNPPFSLFTQYIQQLTEYNKQFLVLGRETSITLKDTFDLVIKNKAWYGYTHAKEFKRPDGTVAKFGNVVWFTNMDVKKRHEKMILFKKYDNESYNHYYNYDGIDIENVSDIPDDYCGNMGVPLSFMFQHNPDQFKIVGLGQSVSKKILHKTVGNEIHFIDAKTKEIVYKVPYSVPERKRGNQLRIDEDGKPGRVPFGRLIIRKVKLDEN